MTMRIFRMVIFCRVRVDAQGFNSKLGQSAVASL